MRRWGYSKPELRSAARMRSRGLAHGAVGQADGGGVRQARGDVDLDVDDDRLDAAESAGADAREHGLARAGQGQPRQSLGAEYRGCCRQPRPDDWPGLPALQSIGTIARLLWTMGRVVAFIYGVVAYAVFFATFLYAAGFVGNLVVPKSLDGAPVGPLGTSLLINLGLLTLFAVQHSVMARPAFKRVWTQVVPQAVERSTYVLASSLALIVLFWQWRPLGGVVWDVQIPSDGRCSTPGSRSAGSSSSPPRSSSITSTCSGSARSGCTSAAGPTCRWPSPRLVRTGSCATRSTSAGCSHSGRRRR